MGDDGLKTTLNKSLRVLLTTFMAVILVFFAFDVANADTSTEQMQGKENWVGAWVTSPQMPYTSGISQKGFNNQTVRSIIHPNLDGKGLRIRFSNKYGSNPLTFGEVHVAVSKGGANIIDGTDHAVTFEGHENVTIAPGAEVLSDPVTMPVKSGRNLTVSVYVPQSSGPTTWHSHSNQTSYISPGNHVADADSSSFDAKENAWFWINGVDVNASPSVKGAIVTLGDSITDGNNSTLNGNHRWPDLLANRLNQGPPGIQKSVLNEGISGNRIFTDGPTVGESALHRLNHDVFGQTGVTDVILLEGINDIRHWPDIYDSDKIIEGMKQIIVRSHSHGLRIFGGTLIPYKGSGLYTVKGEETRQAVNDWIKTSGAFDGYIDFDKAVRDPEHPQLMLPKFDSGDHLHPSDAGYQAMANTIDLSLFKPGKPVGKTPQQ